MDCSNEDVAAKRIRAEIEGDSSAMQIPDDSVDAVDTVPGDMPSFIPGFAPAESGDLHQSGSETEDVDIPPVDSDAVFTPREQAAIVQFWEENPMYWDKADPHFKGIGGVKKRLYTLRRAN